MLRKSISKYLELFKDYTELRIQENRESAIVLLNGDVAHNIKKVTGGLSARAFNSGSWGFSSSPNLSDDAIRLAVMEANQNAQFLRNKSSKKHPELDKIASQGNFDYFTKKIKRSQKELIEFLAELDHYLVKNCPEVKSRKVILKLLDMEKNLLTSDNSWAHSMTPRANIYIFLSGVCDDGSALELYEVLGQLGEFEDIFNSPAELYPTIDKLYQHFLNKKSAVFADAGVKEVILDADLAGILAHEAIGHTVEADIVLGGSVAGDYLGQSVASPLITLVDFAHSEGGKRCPVPVHVDDEGTLAQDVVIIKDGILKSFMHSKESAKHFGVAPTGNARAYAFSDEPLIRMRNTAILSGTSKLEKMIASIEDGYYLMKCGNGQADTTSEFMFGVPLGYQIKNGKLGKAIKETTISGVAFDLLKTVTMVSDDMNWSNGGMCGKKQMIPVGFGGPAIKCKVNMGGR